MIYRNSVCPPTIHCASLNLLMERCAPQLPLTTYLNRNYLCTPLIYLTRPAGRRKIPAIKRRKTMNFNFSKSMAILVSVWVVAFLTMTAAAETSLYMEGMRFRTSSHVQHLQVLPDNELQLRYTRSYPIGISNLNCFWRASLGGSYSYTHYAADSGGFHFGSLNITGAGGLSYQVAGGSHWSLTPFLSVVSVNRLSFAGRDYHIFSIPIEVGVAMTFRKMSLITMYTNKAFLLGLSYDL